MKLRTRVSITAIVAAAAVGTSGAFLLPAASARTITHTIRFTSVQTAGVNYSKTTGAQADKDVNKAGKVVGFDVLRFAYDPKTNKGSTGVVVGLAGGFLYGQLSGTGSVIHGSVTGGTGNYKGAKGTITAKTGPNTAVTITYHT
jgi:hypothetical protein